MTFRTRTFTALRSYYPQDCHPGFSHHVQFTHLSRCNQKPNCSKIIRNKNEDAVFTGYHCEDVRAPIRPHPKPAVYLWSHTSEETPSLPPAQGPRPLKRPLLLISTRLVLSITPEWKGKLHFSCLKSLTLWALDRKHSSALISHSKLSA